MIDLLLDQGLPRSAVAALRAKGYAASHVAEIGLSEAKDIEIIESAREKGKVIVTLDADFHALLKISGHSTPSVLRLRIEGLKGEGVADVIEQVVARVGDDIVRGALVTVDAKTIRVHRL